METGFVFLANMEDSYTIEACVESLSEAILAEKRGAHQVELCANLASDGLTPSLDLTEQVLKVLQIPVKVMIRPRAGDFVFSIVEQREMHAQILALQNIGVQHFVIGFATKEGNLDVCTLKQFCDTYPESNFTLHKVIDSIKDPLEIISSLLVIPNLSSVLTSGGALTAKDGSANIRRMAALLEPQIMVIAAGKITAENLEELKKDISVSNYHGRKIVGNLKQKS